jgi:2-octaprenyl-6-methoxyphenol hydroxylase
MELSMAETKPIANKYADVAIIGGGMIGLTQGLALAAQGISSHIIDRADPEIMLAPGFDGRTSAISSSSMKMLSAIGLSGALAGKGCPIEQIWVSDQLKPGALDFVPSPEDGFLGQMFENRELRRTLYTAAQSEPLIQMHMGEEIAEKQRNLGRVQITLANGKTLAAQLMIVAEGRNSETRNAAGIKFAHWQYDHHAMVGAIYHEHPHNNIAYEIFYATGPFAILPMLDSNGGRHRSAVVWSVKKSDAPGYAKLSPRGFAAELLKAMDGMLGAIEIAAPFAHYPLGFHHCSRITADRLVLIGDSAHGIHPIAGQGLNLGLRDVAALTEVMVDGVRLGLDLGDAQLLDRYDRWRSVDTMMVAASTDTLNRLFSIPGKTASAVRRFGLAMVQRTAPAKAFFMAEARGESGDLPKLLAGMPV